ncbi:MAG: TIGR02206 family membrane protein [Saprospiraceae bacterium]|nr:TIGR02206 family membrane protein [Saprospiraceae bacterium]
MQLFLSLIPDFKSYGVEHFVWLALGTASTVFWIWLGKKQTSDLGQRRIGLIQSLIPAGLWVLVSLYMLLFERPLDWGLILPFHISYFINLVLPFMLWRRSFFLFEITYYIVMGGCIQSLLTPALQHGFPHYLNFRFFVVHMGLLQSILYAIFVYGFRPTWQSFGRAFLWTNIYFVFVLGINYLLGTNFMYLSKKPANPSLLDLFGEWPWYIVGAEFLCLMMFTLVMLPFAFKKQEESVASARG